MLSLDDVRAARARIRRFVRETPLDRTPELGLGDQVYAKLELVQPTGSFKLRGALSKLTALSPAERARGVLTVSAGNHGLAVAWGASMLGVPATVVVPRGAARAKVEAIARYPVELIEEGEGYDAAERWARQHATRRGLTFISPYNDREVIAGQGTIALEILEALPACDALIAPAGGGGLLAGLVVAAKALAPKLEIIAVEPEASPTLSRALAAGRIVNVEERATIADGLAGNIEEGSITVPLIAAQLSEVTLVSEQEIRGAMRRAVEKLHLIVEGSAAVAIAGAVQKQAALRGKTCALVLTGRNIGWPELLAAIAGEEAPA